MPTMRLKNKTAVLLIADGYHEHEYWFPYYRFQEEGAKVITAGLNPGIVHGEGDLSGMHGLEAEIDVSVTDLSPDKIDILFLPGGTYGPMFLRTEEVIQSFIQACFAQNILVCTICHAPWVLVSAGVLKGRRITCPHDMSPDVIGAGAIYNAVKVGDEYLPDKVVVDGNLLSADGFRSLPDMFRVLFDEYFPG